jgi:Kef-type K+ transport system membrane component KefB
MLVAGAFLVIASFVGLYFFSQIVVRIQAAGKKLGLLHGGFAIALALTFFYAFVAELIGLSAIVGAFLAGTMFASTPLREDFQEGARYLGAVFTPIFFISMGLLVNLWIVAAAPGLVAFGVVLIVVAILTKVAGCWVPARLSRMTNRESLAVGLGMAPRGEVGLIVALTALTAGVIGDALFSVIVLVMIVVSVLPAPFFKRTILRIAAERKASATETVNPESPRAT